MKKLKVLFLATALLLAVMLLASCATAKDMKAAFDGTGYSDDAPTLTAAMQVDALKGTTYVSKATYLVYLTDTVVDGENTYQKNIVYNLKTNVVVLEATTTVTTDIDITLKTHREVDYIVVNTTSWQLLDSTPIDHEYKTALVADNGTVLGEVNKNVAPTTVADLIELDGRCYRVAKDGTVAHAFDLGAFSALPAINAQTDEYYYYVDLSSGEVFAYDQSCALIAYYVMPNYATTMQAFPLAGGDVLIQYIVAESEDAEDYTFLLQGGSYYAAPGKYTMHSLVLNVDRNKTKEIDLDYYVLGVNRITDDSWVDSYALDDRYDNIATAVEIKDQRVDTSTNARCAVVLSNSGRVRGELEKLVTAQTTIIPAAVGTNRWTVSNADQQQFLVNEKGKVLGEVTAKEARNECYYIVDGRMYNYDLSLIYDYRVAELEIYNGYEGVMNHGVLFTKGDGELICYANNNAVTIAAKGTACSVYAVADSYFVVRNAADINNVKYDVYNDVGTKLASLDYAPTALLVAENGSCLVYYLQADGQSVYYRVA